MVGIYKIINKTNGKYYVGSSNNIKGRWWNHKYQLSNNKHPNPHLQSSWNKYGKNNFDFIVIEELLPTKLIKVEQSYLDIANNEKKKCYNTSFIVGNPPKLSKEQERIRRDKISKASKISWNNNELRERQRQTTTLYFSNENNRKRFSVITKQIRSNPLIGKKMSDAVRESRKDKTIYRFQHLTTKEIFEGLQLDFRNKYQIHSGNLSAVIFGKRKSVDGWALY